VEALCIVTIASGIYFFIDFKCTPKQRFLLTNEVGCVRLTIRSDALDLIEGAKYGQFKII